VAEKEAIGKAFWRGEGDRPIRPPNCGDLRVRNVAIDLRAGPLF